MGGGTRGRVGEANCRFGFGGCGVGFTFLGQRQGFVNGAGGGAVVGGAWGGRGGVVGEGGVRG